MGSRRSARNAGTARRTKADLALLWVPSVFLGLLGWAAFRDYGWAAWVALLCGSYVGRAVGDLAVGDGRGAGSKGEPRGDPGQGGLARTETRERWSLRAATLHRTSSGFPDDPGRLGP